MCQTGRHRHRRGAPVSQTYDMGRYGVEKAPQAEPVWPTLKICMSREEGSQGDNDASCQHLTIPVEK
jgi:hypothetical protein